MSDLIWKYRRIDADPLSTVPPFHPLLWKPLSAINEYLDSWAQLFRRLKRVIRYRAGNHVAPSLAAAGYCLTARTPALPSKTNHIEHASVAAAGRFSIVSALCLLRPA